MRKLIRRKLVDGLREAWNQACVAACCFAVAAMPHTVNCRGLAGRNYHFLAAFASKQEIAKAALLRAYGLSHLAVCHVSSSAPAGRSLSE